MTTIPLLVCTLIASAPYAVDTDGVGNVTELLVPLASASYTRMDETCIGKVCEPIQGDFLSIRTADGGVTLFRIGGKQKDVPLSTILQNCFHPERQTP